MIEFRNNKIKLSFKEDERMKKKQVLTMTMVVMTAVISGKYGVLSVNAEESQRLPGMQ